MSKRFLSNFLKRQLKFKFFSSGVKKKSLDTWGEKQIEKLGNLGQNLVVMQMS